MRMAWAMMSLPFANRGWRGRRVFHAHARSPTHLQRYSWRGSSRCHGPATCLPSMGSGRQPQEETMRACQRRMPKQAVAAALSGLCLLASACSGFGPDDPRAGLSCVDDSKECVDQRQTTLKAMLADQDRKWVKETANPQAHASGVRL